MADIERFGTIGNKAEVHIYTLVCGNVTARVMDFGAVSYTHLIVGKPPTRGVTIAGILGLIEPNDTPLVA